MISDLIFKHKSIRQQMVDKGVNPHIRDSQGNTQYAKHNFSNLKNVTHTKSVYFNAESVVGVPRTYTNGIYPVNITDVIDAKGGEGIVLGGLNWQGVGPTGTIALGDSNCDKKVALKFVKTDGLKHTVLKTVEGSCLLQMLGHYRLVCF